MLHPCCPGLSYFRPVGGEFVNVKVKVNDSWWKMGDRRWELGI